MNFNLIPEELKQLPIWCVWNLEKGGKIPYNPRTGYKAQSNNLESFTAFKTASKAVYDGGYNGVGIGIFYGISAIDIDHCLNNGVLSDMAADIIQRMNSYTEISPSGNGIRIIFKAPDLQYNKEVYYIHNQKRGLEIYVSGATSKFVTITGNVIKDVPIADCTVALQDILDLYMKRTSSPIHTDTVIVQPTGDFLQIGLEKDAKLRDYWNGVRPHKSESENDFGFMTKLLYWVNGNIDEAIRAFRSSPYAQQKDEEHKKKLERKDYLLMTAKSAMPNRTAAQDNEQWKLEHTAKRITQPIEETDNKVSKGLSIISAPDLQKEFFPPITFLVNDLLPEGTSLLVAAPKIGKSWYVLDMGLKIASGLPFLNKTTTKVGVLYLALEDTHRRLQDRMNKLLKNRPSPTSFYVTTEATSLDNGLIESLESTIQSHPDIKLIIIDTLQKIRSQSKLGNNVYQQDYAEIGAIKSFADKHSISVMFVHHLRKMKDGDDQFNMISGSTALMGAVDTSFVITKKSRNDINATLHITGRDIESGELIMRFNKAICQWELIGNAQDVGKQNEKSEYENNLIVRTIKTLLDESDNGTWTGNAKSLLEAGERITGLHIASSSRSLNSTLKKLQKQLREYDNIIYTNTPNGNAGPSHYFAVGAKTYRPQSADISDTD